MPLCWCPVRFLTDILHVYSSIRQELYHARRHWPMLDLDGTPRLPHIMLLIATSEERRATSGYRQKKKKKSQNSSNEADLVNSVQDILPNGILASDSLPTTLISIFQCDPVPYLFSHKCHTVLELQGSNGHQNWEEMSEPPECRRRNIEDHKSEGGQTDGSHEACPRMCEETACAEPWRGVMFMWKRKASTTEGWEQSQEEKESMIFNTYLVWTKPCSKQLININSI